MARKQTGQILERKTKQGRVFALRFRAYGERRYLTLGSAHDGWSWQRAEQELGNVLADVRRGIWQPPAAPSAELSTSDPSFHQFASDWLASVSPGLAGKTVARYRWQLTNHLLPFFAGRRLSEITVAEVDRYRDRKLRERRLSPDTINGTLTRLGQILDVADERDLIERNPLRVNPRRRRVKASKRRPIWLDRADQISALLDAAGELDAGARADRRGIGRRAMLATLTFGGLRIGELCALRWSDVDLAGGRLNVRDAKSAAGCRYVRVLEPLREELALHRAARRPSRGSEFVFPTGKGNPRTIDNVRERVLKPAIRRANLRLEEQQLVTLPTGLTAHKLRHTFASLLIALGDDPAYVMEQLGHEDPAFTLRLYTHAMRREDGEPERLRTLLHGEPLPPLGTSAQSKRPEEVAEWSV